MSAARHKRANVNFSRHLKPNSFMSPYSSRAQKRGFEVVAL